MTDDSVQLLKYEMVPSAEVEERLKAGYMLHGSPVYDISRHKVCQAVILSEPLLLQRLSPKKRRIYQMSRQGMRPAEIASALKMEAGTVSGYLYDIKLLLKSNS